MAKFIVKTVTKEEMMEQVKEYDLKSNETEYALSFFKECGCAKEHLKSDRVFEGDLINKIDSVYLVGVTQNGILFKKNRVTGKLYLITEHCLYKGRVKTQGGYVTFDVKKMLTTVYSNEITSFEVWTTQEERKKKEVKQDHALFPTKKEDKEKPILDINYNKITSERTIVDLLVYEFLFTDSTLSNLSENLKLDADNKKFLREALREKITNALKRLEK